MSLADALFAVSGLTWLAFLVLWLVWGVVTSRRRKVVSKGASVIPLWLIVTVAVLLRRSFSGFIPHVQESALWSGHPAVAAAGFLIQVCGFAFTIWARSYLGALWSGGVVLREGHTVVDTGPYRLVRHPIYAGLLLAMLGSFLMKGSVFWLVVLVLTTAALLWKALAEERLLTRELGEAYAAYRRRTRMIIPWVL